MPLPPSGSLPWSRPPRHQEIADFISTFLPRQLDAQDVSFDFHSPRHPKYNSASQATSRLVLSITPTSGFYKSLNEPPNRKSPPVGFLHRPWTLNRRAVPRGSLILASHNAFDANLTVGWNIALAERLCLATDEAICIQGYKGDDERKIGLVARLREPTDLSTIVGRARAEFNGAGDLFVHRQEGPPSILVDNQSPNRHIRAVAIMNAFHKDEVDRALKAAHEAGWTSREDQGHDLFYLTGAARPYGIEAVAAAHMPTLCVGHRACEEWGIRYLTEQIRDRFPGLDVIEVLEEEEKRGNDAPSGEQHVPISVVANEDNPGPRPAQVE